MIIALKLLLLVVAVFGNCWFWSSYVNRLYAIPSRDALLDRWRKVSDLAVLIIPVLLAYTLFIAPPAATEILSYQAGALAWKWPQPNWWLLPWSFPLLGITFFLATRINRRQMRNPAGFAVLSRQVHDIEQQLGYQPVGTGKHKYLQWTRLPGNEIFTLELNEKRFCFPNYPAALSPLKVLHVSDLHFAGVIDRPYFEAVFRQSQIWQPDLVVFTGDLLDDLNLLDWLPTTLGQLSAPLGCYYILGNHDWHLQPEQIRQAMNALGWIDCGSRVREISYQGEHFWLGGDERPWMGSAANFSSVPEDAFKILLSHTPDNVYWAQQQKMDLVLSGHNHGGQIKFPGIGPALSPSRYGVRFADGEFFLSPTTLHVSRGVSGRHPLRYRCRPEISLLHLERPQ